MNIIYLLLPVALIFVAIIVWLFMWAVKSDQFDDLEGPAHQILMEDDKEKPPNDPDSGSPVGELPSNESSVKRKSDD